MTFPTDLRAAASVAAELGKFRISVLVTLTALAGAVSAVGTVNSQTVIPVLGTFLLSVGASALNHWQERATDALMPRTKMRPLPSNRVQPSVVLAFVAFAVFNGMCILYLGAGPVPTVIGAIALFWYNGIYTPLKKKSAFSIIPGSVIGALPPLIGWSAMGRNPMEPGIMAVAFFLFMWQIPHFWLLVMKYGNEYESAGFPTVLRIFNQAQLGRVTFAWIVATVLSGLLIPVFGLGTKPFVVCMNLLSGVGMLYVGLKVRKQPDDLRLIGKTFLTINMYALFLLTLLAAESVWIVHLTRP